MFEAYVAGSADALYGTHFARLADWDRASRVARPLEPRLAAALEAQNAVYEKSPARDAHLRALRSGACAVVTGQQTGLFLGPLYTLYKAAAAIRLARWLAERWKAPVVPVFWLQTEDHDAAEIAVCHIARGADHPLTLTLPVAEESVSVAHRLLPDEVSLLLTELAAAVASLPHGDEHVATLSRHYRPGAGWGAAFAGVLASLFAEEGLVLVDPRDPALAPLAAPVHRRALEASASIAQALVERAEALEASGFHAGVHVRPGAPLSFFHPQGPRAHRSRLAEAPGGFVEIGGARTRTLPELLDALDRSPASFTTSALLRPILQDTWLPTIAYVGGPAEVAYFAQLQPVYGLFDVAMPIVVPRTQLRLVERPTRLALARRGLTAAEAIKPFDEAITLTLPALSAASDGERLTQRLVAGIDGMLDAAAPEVAAAGERAVQALEKTRKTMLFSAGKLGQSLDKAILLRDRETVSDLEMIRSRLLPRGVPQERFFAPASFAARYGERAFIDRILAAAEPLRTGFHDVIL
ncbi:MAG TPA: bacillithiol biosynthesis cysteine-adding enzyme BshC [Candidatus Polarisedimenticolaceae bacterium]|nr:bacillithiol biosynthesis cysteine-adding enzyme BshC [Candidatus Polarisedimenticolaceae bacterium]